MLEIIRSVLSTPERRRWPAFLMGAAVLALVAWAATSNGVAAPVRAVFSSTAPPAPDPEVASLLLRAKAVRRSWRAVEEYYERRIAPIERVLLRYRDDPALARRVALALVIEAQRVDLEPRLLLAVLLVENPWLDPAARSSVGAIGLMQVMPVHRGEWPACRSDLEDIEANICYGAQIFAHYFRLEHGDLDEALLRYNGCVHGTNTPHCDDYPSEVFARAGRASLLAWLHSQPAGAAAAP